MTMAKIDHVLWRDIMEYLRRRHAPICRQWFEELEPLEMNSGLLKVHTAWQCDYESFRQFIYALESASPFVIIDDVTLAQSDPTKPLTLTMELSTYFRLASHGH